MKQFTANSLQFVAFLQVPAPGRMNWQTAASILGEKGSFSTTHILTVLQQQTFPDISTEGSLAGENGGGRGKGGGGGRTVATASFPHPNQSAVCITSSEMYCGVDGETLVRAMKVEKKVGYTGRSRRFRRRQRYE